MARGAEGSSGHGRPWGALSAAVTDPRGLTRAASRRPSARCLRSEEGLSRGTFKLLFFCLKTTAVQPPSACQGCSILVGVSVFFSSRVWVNVNY